VRLITSETEIDRIVGEAVGRFKRSFQDGKFVATDAECSTPFWRETMYDLIRLAVVSYSIVLKYEDALTRQHQHQQTRVFSFWKEQGHDFKAVITRGLSSISPVEFSLFALGPFVVHTTHGILYEEIDASIEENFLLPAEEWFDAIDIAEHHLLLGERVSTEQKNRDTMYRISGLDLF